MPGIPQIDIVKRESAMKLLIEAGALLSTMARGSIWCGLANPEIMRDALRSAEIRVDLFHDADHMVNRMESGSEDQIARMADSQLFHIQRKREGDPLNGMAESFPRFWNDVELKYREIVKIFSSASDEELSSIEAHGSQAGGGIDLPVPIKHD